MIVIDYVNMSVCVKNVDASQCLCSTLIKVAPIYRHAEYASLSQKAPTQS